MCSECLFFFKDTATTEIYPLSLHDALPISATLNALDDALGSRSGSPPLAWSCWWWSSRSPFRWEQVANRGHSGRANQATRRRSEEHTSELQSRQYLVCRLLLEKKTKIYKRT